MSTKCLCIETRLASQLLTNLYDDAMSASGTTVTQFSQLHKIKKLDNPTLKQLAEATGLDRSTLGRNVRLMESAGLVRTRPGKDARTRVLQLTRKGGNALHKAVPLWQDAQSRVIENLGPKKHALMQELLQDLATYSKQLKNNDNPRGAL